MRKATFHYELLLSFLGVRVVISCDRDYDGRTDVDQVGNTMISNRIKYVAGRFDIVANEQVGSFAGNLSMQLYNASSAGKGVRPLAGLGQISLDGRDVRVHLSKNRKVIRVFVDGYDVCIALSFQLDNQVLADQPSSTRQYQLAMLFYLAHGVKVS